MLLTDELLATLRLFDADEAGLATARSRLDDDRCRFLAGDVRDATHLRYAMADVDVVIHAAAMTHVDAVEVTPVEAVETSVFGTHHVIRRRSLRAWSGCCAPQPTRRSTPPT